MFIHPGLPKVFLADWNGCFPNETNFDTKPSSNSSQSKIINNFSADIQYQLPIVSLSLFSFGQKKKEIIIGLFF